MTLEQQAKMIYQCSQTDEGRVLLDFIQDEAVKEMRGTSDEIQLQAGKFNLWLSIGEIIIEGKGD